jgi:hypothetical protein
MRRYNVGEDVFKGEIGFSTKLSKDQWPEEKQAGPSARPRAGPRARPRAAPAVSSRLFATNDSTE